tara:strand:+ start:320 stop:571 length:252 start_codon:yes stop_codon:yes gene_type:complete
MQIDKNILIPKPKYKYNTYKWKCIKTMRKMKIGDSIKIKDRTLWTVKNTWIWRAKRKSDGTLNKFNFQVKSINHTTQRIWRIK